MTTLRALVLLAVLLAPLGVVEADQRVLVLDPALTSVAFTVKATFHDVQGAFAVQTGTLRFDPAAGEASGEVTIDLRGARTGSSSRDRTMHEEVLETPTHPLAVFHLQRIAGTLAPAGTSEVSLQGTLTFHGADHPMSLPAKVTVSGAHVVADVAVDIPYVAWGLHDPSILVLRVAKVANVRVRTEGELSAPLATAK
jgi:polyisoprenoid-binding protein YceI